MKSFIVSFLFILSGFLGFLSQSLYASVFGASLEMDLYFAILSIPSIVTGISGTIFNAVLIPILAAQPTEKRSEYIATLQKVIIKISLIITVLLSCMMIFYAYRLTLGTNLLSISLILCALLTINTYLTIINGFRSAVLNFERLFYIVSAVPLLVYICNIISVLTLGHNIGVISIAIGMCIAAISQFITYKYTKKDIFIAKNEFIIDLDYKFLIKRILLITFSLLPFTIFSGVAYLWASYSSNGGISYLGYSHSFSGFISIAVSMGIATVTFPDIAVALRSKKQSDIKNTMAQFENTILFVILLNLSICVFFTLHVKECIELLLKRGQFGMNEIECLSKVLPYYLFGGAFISLLNLTRNVFYSSNSYRSQALLGIFSVSLFISCFLVLTNKVDYVTIGIVENSILLLLLICSLYLLHKRYNVFGWHFACKTIEYLVILLAAASVVKYFCVILKENLAFQIIIEIFIYYILSSIIFLYIVKDNNIMGIYLKVLKKCRPL